LARSEHLLPELPPRQKRADIDKGRVRKDKGRKDKGRVPKDAGSKRRYVGAPCYDIPRANAADQSSSRGGGGHISLHVEDCEPGMAVRRHGEGGDAQAPMAGGRLLRGQDHHTSSPLQPLPCFGPDSPKVSGKRRRTFETVSGASSQSDEVPGAPSGGYRIVAQVKRCRR